MPKTKWFELNDQRDAEGNLTKLALALEAISSWGCDCGTDEPESCLSCLCEAALKELHEKVVGYEAEVKQLNSLLAANRLLTRAALGEMFQWDSVGIRIVKLEEERDEALAEVERLKAHTWEQERAAIVTWLRKQWEDHPCVPQDEGIEHGEHWMEEKTL